MKKVLILLFVSMIFLGLAGPALAADPGAGFNIKLPNPLCPSGLDASGNALPCVNDFTTLISKVTGYIAGIVGTLAGLMFVISGIMFVISGGNTARVAHARTMALFAAIGAGITLAGAGLIEVIKAIIPPVS